MNNNAIEALVDQAPIAAHEEAMRAGAVRLAAARSSLAVEQAAHALAAEAAAAAEAGVGDMDPQDADQVLAAAERRLGVATRVLEKSEAAIQAVNANHRVALGEAYLPVYRAGIQRRLKSAAKADRARALLTEAQADFDEATEILRHSARNGNQYRVGEHGHNHTMTTLAAETARWSAPHSWWLPVAGL